MNADAPKHSQSEEIDIAEVISIVWSRKWFVILFATLCSLLAFNFVNKQPERYESDVLLMFKESSTNQDTLQNIMTSGLTAADNTETELELLKSRRFAGQIVDNLKLIENAHYQRTTSASLNLTPGEFLKKRRSDAVDVFMANRQVKKTSGTNLVRVSYRTYSPQHAAKVANEIAQTFIIFKEELLELKNQTRSEWLEDKLSGVRESLRLAEQKIVDHQNEHEFIDIDSAMALEKSKLEQLSKEKFATERKVEGLELLKSQINRYQQNPQQLFNIPEIAGASRVIEIKRQLALKTDAFAQVKLRYKSKHPTYIKAQNIYLDAKKELDEELQSQIDSVDKKLEVQNSNLNMIESDISNASNRLKRLGVIEFEYQKLRREFDANLELYENLVKKLKESDMMQDLANASNVLIVEQAEIPNNPISRKLNLKLAMAFIFSTAIAVVIVLLEAFLANRVLQFRKVARNYNTRILGVIPKVKVKQKNKPLHELDMNKHMNFFEAMRTARSNILVDNHLSKQKVIAITSISPNDGKSSLSIQLAGSFSELEKVILVDADLRYPSIGEVLNYDLNHPGLTNLIAKRSKLKECITTESRFEFDVLPAGFRAKNPLLYLSQPRLQQIIRYLKQNYDRVVKLMSAGDVGE